MCGIVGAAGSLYKREQDVFSNLLAWDIVRGPHATGIAAIKRSNNEVNILKRAFHAYDLMDLKQYDSIIGGTKVLIGHNRFATVGANSHRNAHPFYCDNIIGVHNGTIPYSDRKSLVEYNKYDTDSEAIYWNINDRGAEETIKDLRGAWSLVWWDRRDNTLNFLRNKERPMYYTISESGQDIFWASEVGMLRAALARHDVKHKDVYQTPEDVLLSFAIPDASKAIETPMRKVVKGASPFVFQGPQQGGHHYENWDQDTWLEEWRQKHPQWAVRRNGIEENQSHPALQLTGPEVLSPNSSSVEKPGTKPPGEDSLVQRSSPNIQGKTSKDEKDVKASKGAEESEIPFTLELEPATFVGEDDKKVIPLGRRGSFVLVKDNHGAWINKEIFDKRTKDGCAYCQKQVEFKTVARRQNADDTTIMWLGNNAFLCVECSDDSEILDYLANCNMVIPEKQRLN